MRWIFSLLSVAIAVSLVTLSSLPEQAAAQEKKDKEKAKDPLEGKRGKTVGKLTDKGPNFIEVTADGEEKGRRYVPEWVGGNPDKGGGPDKAIVKLFTTLTVGSRVEVDWVFHERFRALDVKVIRAAQKK